MIANMIVAGDIQLFDSEPKKPQLVKRALVIQFDSDEAIREAIQKRMVEFTVFEHYESAEWRAVIDQAVPIADE